MSRKTEGPTVHTRSAFKIVKGQFRRSFGKRGRPRYAGGDKPHPGTNPAVLVKRERDARRAAYAAAERDLAGMD